MAKINKSENQVDRVRKFGEVKTQNNEIKNMLNLVNNEIDRVDSRFLEPACGDGNFLYEILNKKLQLALKNSKNKIINFEIQAIYGLSSLYGVELLEDNVEKTKLRLKNLLEEFFFNNFKINLNEDYNKSINIILDLNIIHGDALSFKSQKDKKKDITFSEWTMINNTDFKRRDYTFKDLLAYQPIQEENLFSDLGDQAFIPHPVKEFPPKHYLKLYEYSKK
jgi:hypothetical protein